MVPSMHMDNISIIIAKCLTLRDDVIVAKNEPIDWKWLKNNDKLL